MLPLLASLGYFVACHCRDQTATYITKFVAGAKNTYGLDIDYIGEH